MVVGASAAFSDHDMISNAEAVDGCKVEYVTETVTDDNGQTATKVVLKDKVVAGSNDKLTLIKDKYGVDKPAVK